MQSRLSSSSPAQDQNGGPAKSKHTESGDKSKGKHIKTEISREKTPQQVNLDKANRKHDFSLYVCFLCTYAPCDSCGPCIPRVTWVIWGPWGSFSYLESMCSLCSCSHFATLTIPLLCWDPGAGVASEARDPSGAFLVTGSLHSEPPPFLP